MKLSVLLIATTSVNPFVPFSIHHCSVRSGFVVEREGSPRLNPLLLDPYLNTESDEDGRKPPKFPGSVSPWKTARKLSARKLSDKLILRDNSEYLEKLDDQALFLRPTQMGKSSLFDLADLLYNREYRDPPQVKYKPGPEDANTWFVLKINFLPVVVSETQDVTDIDRDVGYNIAQTIGWFVTDNGLQEFYVEPQGETAGEYLKAAFVAVSKFGQKIGEDQRLLVLVDEYDRPVRDKLIALVGTDNNEQIWMDIESKMKNYRSFFSTCKAIATLTRAGLEEVKVWVTGVLPVGLHVISDFKPVNYSFKPDFADPVGLREGDVNRMLDEVEGYLAFKGDERDKVLEAIKVLAHQFHFVTDTPLYHTRVVNSLMAILLDTTRREAWLQNLSIRPPGTYSEQIPESILNVVRNQDNVEVRRAIVSLSLNQEVTESLVEDLVFKDILSKKMKVEHYLALLVHLGVASVRCQRGTYIYKVTSEEFRMTLLEKFLENDLKPLITASSLDEIYKIGKTNLKSFMEAFALSGLSSVVSWAKGRQSNQAGELQFQDYFIGGLEELTWQEETDVSQENSTPGKGRTDVTIRRGSTLLLLDLKQQLKRNSPSPYDNQSYHKQLHERVKELTSERPCTKVAGFLVLMYNRGESFEVEPTTFWKP